MAVQVREGAGLVDPHTHTQSSHARSFADAPQSWCRSRANGVQPSTTSFGRAHVPRSGRLADSHHACTKMPWVPGPPHAEGSQLMQA